MKSDMVSGYLVSIHKSYLMGLVVTTTYPSFLNENKKHFLAKIWLNIVSQLSPILI